MEREGWLIKNGERRYCYVTANEINWADKPFGKVKNALSLRRYILAIDADSLRNGFLLRPGIGAGKKEYAFEASDSNDADKWVEAIKSWDVESVFPMGSPRTRARQQATAGAEEIVVRSQASAKNLARHSGWLMKKGKRRFFLIHHRVLYWSEHALSAPSGGQAGADPSAELNTDEGREFLRKVSGSLSLSNLSVELVGDDAKSIEIVMSSSGTHYLLVASLSSEAAHWVEAIRFALATQGQLDLADTSSPTANSDHFSSASGGAASSSSSSSSSSEAQQRRGHLQVKGSGRQFVLLRRGVLLWYNHEEDSQPKGVVRVQRCSLERSADGHSFSVVRDDGRVHRFTSKQLVETARWVDALAAAMKTESIREQTSSREFSDVMQATMTVDSLSLSQMAAAQTGGAGDLNRHSSEATIAPRKRPGRSYTNAAGRDYRRSFYQNAHKSAWVDFKSKRKFLVLRNNTCLLFEKEAGSELASNALHSFPLQGCTLSRGGGDAGPGPGSHIGGSSSSSSSSSRTIILHRSSVDLNRSDSIDHDVKFKFLDLSVAAEWELALQLAVDRCASTSTTDLSAPEAQQQLVCDGTLVKKGKERYFRLYGSGVLAWFVHKEDAAGAAASTPRNHLLLQDCSVLQIGATALLAISLPTGKRYELLAPTPVEARRWLGHLTEVAKSATAKLHPYRVFGEPLPAVSSSADPATLVPAVVLDTLAELRERYMEIPGLFRESGDAFDISMLKDNYDAGLRPTLPRNSPHECAGLLKLYLRSLPTGLVPEDSARQWLDCDDGTELLTLVEQLPAANRAIFAALLDLLADFSLNAEKTKMGARNLAISFGTSLLRPPGTELEVLADTPAAIQTIETLINTWRQKRKTLQAQPPPLSSLPDAEEQHLEPRQPRLSIPVGAECNLQLLSQISSGRQLGQTILSALKQARSSTQDEQKRQDLDVLIAMELETE